MNLKIICNPDVEFFNKISQAVKDNQGYCPCLIEQNEETLCICRDFKEQDGEGYCHCRRYLKVITEL
jgi:hypothetical protein